MSFNANFTNADPVLFPIEVPVITAFWTDTSSQSALVSWEYLVINADNGASTIEHIEEFLKSKSVKLNITLAVTAKWSSTILFIEVYMDIKIVLGGYIFISGYRICYHSNRW